MTATLRFHERMAGWIAFGEASPNQAAHAGRRAGYDCAHSLEIEIDDLERFIADPAHRGRPSGHLDCPALGGRFEVCPGSSFNLFLASEDAPRRPRMLYRLLLEDAEGRRLTLSGFKEIADDPGLDIWGDTTRLFVWLFAGHLDTDPDDDARTVATGILYISHFQLLRMIGSFRAEGVLRTLRSAERFGRFFARELLRAYGERSLSVSADDFPVRTPLETCWQGHPPGQWHELPGEPGLRRRIIGFTSDDPQATPLTLHHIRGDREPGRGVVLLLHGGAVRANLFYGAPAPSLTRALIDAGYDVWLSNWRASIDLPARQYTLDQAAAYDHPAAVAMIRRLTGARTMGAVVQCQGSTSLTISAISGLVPEITTVVSNAVSLHIDVPRSAMLKLHAFVPPLGWRLTGLDAQWAVRAPSALAQSVGRVARVIRHADCDNDVCRMANYMLGVGPDVLWRHANLDPATHEWVNREFGFVPFSLLRQIGRAQRRGFLEPVDGLGELPASFVDHAPQTDARFVFVAGSENRLFLPSSQRRTFEHFETFHPGRHAHHLLPGYTHLDVLLGRAAAREVFPLILDELGRDTFD